jgi:glycosyltransferase involved in cell wall biosynthesis
MLVSVIIPCYNVENYITTCLTSVANQTYSDLEVMCVDDGSTDSTKLKIQEFITANPDFNIQLISQENKGAPAARNNGIRNAKGSYIQFLDADDQLLPEKIEKQLKLAETNYYPDLIVGSHKKVDEDGKFILEKIYNGEIGSIWLRLIEANLGNTCSNLFKSEKFKNEVNWNENLKSSQEYTLMFELLKANATVVFDSVIQTIIVSRTSGSISTLNKKENWKRYIELRKDILNYIKDHQIEVELDNCYQLIFSAIRSLYPYDSKQAIIYFKELLPHSFKPTVSLATTKSYLTIYNLVGFRLTEKIKKIMK